MAALFIATDKALRTKGAAVLVRVSYRLFSDLEHCNETPMSFARGRPRKGDHACI